MIKKKLIIWGATGQCLVLEEIVRSEFDIVALFDNRLVPTPLNGVPLYKGYEGFEQWKKTKSGDLSNTYFIVAIGGPHGSDRLRLHEYLKSNGLISVKAIHSTSFVAYNAEIGEGAQLLANTSICVRVKLGKSVIINTAASIDHEGIIYDGVHIGPGAKLAGCVTVKANTFIGTGCVILPGIQIGANSIIGAGSVVTRNIPEDVIAYGNPCKIQKQLK
jgi:sugar O-acyltransferase (sialic acid O-acetyltransferase NeuD family)